MAKITDYVGKTKYHFFYSIPKIQDKQSALNWAASITKKKMFYVKGITVGDKTIKPDKSFLPEKFVDEYKEYPCEKISVELNFHQYELMFRIDVRTCQIEMMFPIETMVDYQMVEDCLHLNA